MMSGHMKTLLSAASLLALTACASNDANFATFGKEAGSVLDEGGCGNPTMNNTLVQTGQKSYVIDLSRRFSAETPSTVNFDFNSDRLDANAQAALRQQANWIRQFPEVRFKVFGHTDLVGSNAYNKRLGRARANAVVHFLASQGIDRSRLEALVSYGETQPLVVSEGRERQNRRTVTEVSGFVESHPSVLNGKYAEVIFRDYATNGPFIRSELEGITGAEVATGN